MSSFWRNMDGRYSKDTNGQVFIRNPRNQKREIDFLKKSFLHCNITAVQQNRNCIEKEFRL